jgi:glycosyltransferase involved in cell wall biosynthesis
MHISIIIPAFNAETSIEESISSVLQAVRNYDIEIIVVDDASTDQTWQKLQKLKEKIPQLVVLKNGRAKGPSGARNSGLDLASGEYLAFLDADDIWCQDHLERGITFLRSNLDVDLVFFNQSIVDRNTMVEISNWIKEKEILREIEKSTRSEDFFVLDGNIASALVKESFMHLQTLICKRSVVKNIRFDERVFRGEDMDFCIHLAAQGCKFSYTEIITGTYYRSESSLTACSYANDIRGFSNLRLLYRKFLERNSYYGIEKKLLKQKIFKTLIAQSYPLRKSRQYRKSLAGLFVAFRYGYSSAQIKEIAKACVEPITLILKKSRK